MYLQDRKLNGVVQGNVDIFSITQFNWKYCPSLFNNYHVYLWTIYEYVIKIWGFLKTILCKFWRVTCEKVALQRKKFTPIYILYWDDNLFRMSQKLKKISVANWYWIKHHISNTEFIGAIQVTKQKETRNSNFFLFSVCSVSAVSQKS